MAKRQAAKKKKAPIRPDLLTITVDADRQFEIKSPNGLVENGILTDVIQVLTNMVRSSPVPLPKQPTPEMESNHQEPKVPA